MKITSHLFEAFLQCATRCHLRSLGETGAGNEYAEWVRRHDESYQGEAARCLLETVPDSARVVSSPAIENLKTTKWRLAVHADLRADRRADSRVRGSSPNEETAGLGGRRSDWQLESRLHAVEHVPAEGRGPSLWADTIADEGKIWREFLAILETVKKPALIHYGSYETSFLKQMAERHGRAPEASPTANAMDSAINLVSVMFAKIYLPTCSNSLNEFARHLDFEWSRTDASGTGSMAWRHDWEKSHAEVLMRSLTTDNSEACVALARLKERRGDLLVKGGKANGSTNVVHADSLPSNFNHTFKTNQFQFPEFQQIKPGHRHQHAQLKSSRRVVVTGINALAECDEWHLEPVQFVENQC